MKCSKLINLSTLELCPNDAVYKALCDTDSGVPQSRYLCQQHFVELDDEGMVYARVTVKR